MGGIVGKGKKSQIGNESESFNNLKLEIDRLEKDYEDDVKDAANLAIAIQKEDFTTNWELTVFCENLPKMDTFSLTDPMVAVFVERDAAWKEIGKTEIIPETLNPKFSKTFVVQYNYDKPQKLKFEIYDVDQFDTKGDLNKQQLIGYIECDMHEIVCSPTQSITRALDNKKFKKKKLGSITIRGAEYDFSNSKHIFHLSGKDFLSKYEIFIRLSAHQNDSREPVTLHSTDPEKNQRKSWFEWKKFTIPSSKFSDEQNTIVRVEVFEFNKKKGNISLGELEIGLGHMIESSGKILQVQKNGLFVGNLKLIEVKKITRYSFLNYIYAGCEISLICALDFTNSNKPPSDPSSLHYIGSENLSEEPENNYLLAIKKIGGILQYYDSDNHIPVYGFGAKLLPYYNTVSHCFALNGDFFAPEIQGLDEIARIYKETVPKLRFHGPTVFSEIIKMAADIASSEANSQSHQRYYILLILTDGNISDPESTVDEIIKASDLPLTIIVVGIGDGDFTMMERLDSDNKLMVSKIDRRQGNRDIVQFVKFNKYKDDLENLAKETLAEVPKQFLDYMLSHKLEPMKTTKNFHAATTDFMHARIEERKERKFNFTKQTPHYLEKKKADFIEQLINIGYERDIVSELINDEGVAASDVNLVCELISEYKNNKKRAQGNNNSSFLSMQPSSFRPREIPADVRGGIINQNPHTSHRFFKVRNKSQMNNEKLKKKKEVYHYTKEFLQENSQFVNMEDLPYMLHRPQKKEQLSLQAEDELLEQRWQKKILKEDTEQMKMFKMVMKTNNHKMHLREENKCLLCVSHEIDIVLLPCGHACCCFKCLGKLDSECLICNNEVISYVAAEKKTHTIDTSKVEHDDDEDEDEDDDEASEENNSKTGSEEGTDKSHSVIYENEEVESENQSSIQVTNKTDEGSRSEAPASNLNLKNVTSEQVFNPLINTSISSTHGNDKIKIDESKMDERFFSEKKIPSSSKKITPDENKSTSSRKERISLKDDRLLGFNKRGSEDHGITIFSKVNTKRNSVATGLK